MIIRIIIADDHKIVRDGIRAILEKESDIEVVAEAEDGKMALELTEELRPDIVIMDLAMPDMTGMQAIQMINEKVHETKIIVLSMHSDKQFVYRALKAGVHGYMIKECAGEELIRAIRAVVADQTYLSPTVSRCVVDGYLRNLPSVDTGYLYISNLTPRECEILKLILEGKNTKDIASIFHLSTKTVETHRQRIMTKLHINNMVDLTKFAIREGLISIEN